MIRRRSARRWRNGAGNVSAKRMTSPAPFPYSRYLAPRFWPTWFGFLLLRLSTLLPYSWLLKLGRGVGNLAYHLIPRRRNIVTTNIRLAFPDKSESAQQQLIRENFHSSGIAIFEVALAWWGKPARLRSLYRVEGLEHMDAALENGKGAIMLGGHFTPMLLCGRLLALELPFNILVKPAKNPLFEAMMAHYRTQQYGGVIDSGDLRSMVKALKRNEICWYSPDQDFGREGSVFAPFMGVQTATLTMTARLAKMSRAPIVPIDFHRHTDGSGYTLTLRKPWFDFPSGEDVADASRINAFLQEQVERYPAQYLWAHRRFRTRPEGEAALYQ